MMSAVVNLHDLYIAECAASGFDQDVAQIALIEELQSVLDALMARQAQSDGILFRIKQTVGLTGDTFVSGLYVWGGVGRGKTLLMDLFFSNLPIEYKKRVHFHRFMLDVHQQLHQLKSQQNPLSKVAERVAEKNSVLCLDELFVADITDAMVLAGLFKELFARGVVLIVTSNTAVKNLYQNGLQRERFLPAIELLQQHCTLHHMGGDIDYRLRTLLSATTYVCPHCEDTDENFTAVFQRLAGDSLVSQNDLTIHGRTIPVRLIADGLCWFDFKGICEGPRSKVDYVELSRLFHTIFLSNIPLLGIEGDDPARRFVELIDELYDRRVNVVISAAQMPEHLYCGKRLSHSFERTVSRLREFSSADYIALSHRP